MKKPDLTSTVVAGVVGAIVLSVLAPPLICGEQCDDGPMGPYLIPATGFLVGAGVQVGVRVIGVS